MTRWFRDPPPSNEEQLECAFAEFVGSGVIEPDSKLVRCVRSFVVDERGRVRVWNKDGVLVDFDPSVDDLAIP